MNDTLLHKTKKQTKKETKRHSSKLKEILHNTKQREELMKACTKGDFEAGIAKKKKKKT
jgi:hypothetical protein